MAFAQVGPSELEICTGLTVDELELAAKQIAEVHKAVLDPEDGLIVRVRTIEQERDIRKARWRTFWATISTGGLLTVSAKLADWLLDRIR